MSRVKIDRVDRVVERMKYKAHYCSGEVDGVFCEFCVKSWECGGAYPDDEKIVPGAELVCDVNPQFPQENGVTAYNIRINRRWGQGRRPGGERGPGEGFGAKLRLERRKWALELAIHAKRDLEEYKELSLSKVAEKFESWLAQ